MSMKIARSQLRRIIAEEKQKLLNEGMNPLGHVYDALHDEIIDIVRASILEGGYEAGAMSVEEARHLHTTVKNAAEEAFENAMLAAGMEDILRMIRE